VRDRYPFLAHDEPLAFAHRGGAGAWPENTLPAFQASIDLGFTHLETDVHLTADGVLVAFHDDQLDRVTDRTGRIDALPWSEVRRANVGGREPIPLLEDLLGAFPDAFVNIDPKHDRAVPELVAAIQRTGAIDRVCIGAFSDRRLGRLRAMLGPRLCTSLGPIGTARLRAASKGVPVGRLLVPCAQVPVAVGGVTLVDEAFVTEAHRRGIDVHVWTVDDPDEMRRLLDLGVDGIMTDVPSVLRTVLDMHPPSAS